MSNFLDKNAKYGNCAVSTMSQNRIFQFDSTSQGASNITSFV
ncbi:MAG: hypothetical protein ACOYOA_13560 [Saprospiraceae bacterium]